jgi:hyperosmotically inducible protein
MKNYTSFVLGLAVASVLAAVPVKADREKSQTGDSWVTAKTKIALFADPRVKGSEINVETKAGVVMIRGKVDSEEAKMAAEQITKSINGAASVKNELQVVPRSQREHVEEKDDVITAHVKDELKSIKHSNIGVMTNAGVVSLTGDVDTMRNSAKASWKAWMVGGVKSVKNDLTVKPK